MGVKRPWPHERWGSLAMAWLLLGHHILSDIKDLLDRLLTAPGTPVGSLALPEVASHPGQPAEQTTI